MYIAGEKETESPYLLEFIILAMWATTLKIYIPLKSVSSMVNGRWIWI